MDIKQGLLCPWLGLKVYIDYFGFHFLSKFKIDHHMFSNLLYTVEQKKQFDIG